MAMLSGRKSLVFKPRNRSLSQFRAFTCFVLADRVIGLVEIEFLLLAIMRFVHAWSEVSFQRLNFLIGFFTASFLLH